MADGALSLPGQQTRTRNRACVSYNHPFSGLARQTATDLSKKCRTPDIQLQRHTSGLLTKASARDDQKEAVRSWSMVNRLASRVPGNKSTPSQALMQPDGPLSGRLQCEFPSIVYSALLADH